MSKQHSKQAKTGEVERNYKVFANPVFINPGRIIHSFNSKSVRSSHSLNAVWFLLSSYFTPAFQQLFQFVALNLYVLYRVQRKSFLQLAIWASWSYHLLAQTSFHLASKASWRAELADFTVLLLFEFLKKHHLPRQLKTGFTSPIAKSTSPGLSNTTFFACWL